MIVCGVKVSHDGGIAVIDGNRLLFSIELEKLDNSPRYSDLGDLERIAELLASEGLAPSDVDQFVVDGWFPARGRADPAIPTAFRGRELDLPVAPYVGTGRHLDPLERHTFSGPGALAGGYASYTHASNHLLGAYCTSPFAARGEDALVLVWDGGMLPRLYHVDAARARVNPVGPLFGLVGNIFAGCCWGLEPFARDQAGVPEREALRYLLGVAGKAMAYAALGTVQQDAYPVFHGLLGEFNVLSSDTAYEFGAAVAARKDVLFPGMSNADIIATFQSYLGDQLVRHLTRVIRRDHNGHYPNLCLAGGCALNIKWNSQVRASGLVDEVWVPPFANDSGAAIGTAVCEMAYGGSMALDWDVYRGPALSRRPAPSTWSPRPCDERRLARILHEEGEPVVVLAGRAELGPRALGNRSILAPATDARMKDRLNDMKGRATYRPVAPICLRSRAAEVFEPGGDDRYMLFEHRMRPGWAARVPAVVHLDGTARLQTIEPDTPGTAAGRILSEYERLSGIPVLCNTSANLNGSGFFPDAASAAEWGGVRYVWSDGILYTNPNPAGRDAAGALAAASG